MNLVYHRFVMNMTPAQRNKFDLDLAPQELKEEMIDRQNAEQMNRLISASGQVGRPKPVPLPHRRRRRTTE